MEKQNRENITDTINIPTENDITTVHSKTELNTIGKASLIVDTIVKTGLGGISLAGSLGAFDGERKLFSGLVGKESDIFRKCCAIIAGLMLGNLCSSIVLTNLTKKINKYTNFGFDEKTNLAGETNMLINTLIGTALALTYLGASFNVWAGNTNQEATSVFSGLKGKEAKTFCVLSGVLSALCTAYVAADALLISLTDRVELKKIDNVDKVLTQQSQTKSLESKK